MIKTILTLLGIMGIASVAIMIRATRIEDVIQTKAYCEFLYSCCKASLLIFGLGLFISCWRKFKYGTDKYWIIAFAVAVAMTLYITFISIPGAYYIGIDNPPQTQLEVWHSLWE